MRSRRLIGVVGAICALTVTIAPPAGARKTHVLRVIDSSDSIVANFYSAKCVKNKRGFFATTPHPDGQKYLHVRIEEFSGFHNYDLTVGANADPYVIFAATDGTALQQPEQATIPLAGRRPGPLQEPREAHGGRLQPGLHA